MPRDFLTCRQPLWLKSSHHQSVIWPFDRSRTWETKTTIRLTNGNIFRVTGPLRGIHRWPVASQRSEARSFDVFFDLGLNKRSSKQSGRRSFETPSCPLWRHCDGLQSPLNIFYANGLASSDARTSAGMMMTKFGLCIQTARALEMLRIKHTYITSNINRVIQQHGRISHIRLDFVTRIGRTTAVYLIKEKSPEPKALDRGQPHWLCRLSHFSS